MVKILNDVMIYVDQLGMRKVVYHMKDNHFIAPLYQNLKVPGKRLKA